jgi:uncharacterized membrane protein YqiK
MFLVYLNIVLIVIVAILLVFLFFMKRYMKKEGFIVRDRKGNPIETTADIISEEDPEKPTEEKQE